MRKSRILLTTIASLWVLITVGYSAMPAHAGDTILSNNAGDSSSIWFIDGEPTLVMNGFDLTPLNVSLPVQLDAVSIAVRTPVPSESVQVVIYEDPNGGSPVDATLAYQTAVTIQNSGTVRIPLPQTVTIDTPVVWVGFYFPVGFEFFADESGSSVLTYWAWTPGSTFNLSNLSSAAVFGPADGSSPVNIDLGGVARITAEIITNGAASNGAPTAAGKAPVGQQIPGGNTDLSVMTGYPYCGESIIYDPQDILVSARGAFTIHCRTDYFEFEPGQVRNANELPESPTNYLRRTFLYNIFGSADYSAPNSSEKFRVPVTHCLRPSQADLDAAVIAIAYGAPREWVFLPTVRYNEWVCAEMTHAGYISYFVPRADDIQVDNVDLTFSGPPELRPIVQGSDRGWLCGFDYLPLVDIKNAGLAPSGQFDLRLRMTHDRTGTLSYSKIWRVPSIAAGETVQLRFEFEPFTAPSVFVNESHTMVWTLDANNNLNELNEDNNIYRVGSRLLINTNKCGT